jgi:hypothetical protein
VGIVEQYFFILRLGVDTSREMCKTIYN